MQRTSQMNFKQNWKKMEQMHFLNAIKKEEELSMMELKNALKEE